MKKIILSILLALILVGSIVYPVSAQDPTVSITVTAQVVSITNTRSSWALGTLSEHAMRYFSDDGAENQTYSRIDNI